VLYELAHADGVTAAEVGRELGLDAGYLSRILRRFEGARWSPASRRRATRAATHLRLTDAGRAAFAELDGRAREDVGARVGRLTAGEQCRLLGALATVRALLGRPTHGRPPDGRAAAPTSGRPRLGDRQRNGALYAAEYGWDASYEGLVARIVADFARDFDPALERCWIAERDGENVGCVFLVKHPERPGVARSPPAARRALRAGARRRPPTRRRVRPHGACARLRADDPLDQQRPHLGAPPLPGAGFHLVDEAPHRSFGRDLVGQTWEMALR
jgi:DNA-binding MarR family transcriptional regulator